MHIGKMEHDKKADLKFKSAFLNITNVISLFKHIFHSTEETFLLRSWPWSKAI